MKNATTVPTVTNPANGTDAAPYTDAVGKSLEVSRLVVLCVSIIVGFPKNLQIIFILYKNKNLRKVPHVLLGNLSIVSTIASGYYLPLFLFITLMGQFFHKAVPDWLCIARYSSSVFLLGVQALTLVSMAVDRADSVVRPFKRRITTSNAWKVVKGIWSLAALPFAVHLYFSVQEAKGNCYGQQSGRTVSVTFTLLVAIFYIFLTTITIFATFWRILKRLRSSPFAKHNQNSELRVTRFTYVVLSFFALSWFPLVFFVPLNLIFRFKSPYVGQIKSLLLSITNLNYAVNPFAHMGIIEVALRARAGPAKAGREPAEERSGPAGTEQRADKVERNLEAEPERDKDPSTAGRRQVGERAELAAARSESPAESRPGTAGAEEQVDEVEGDSDGAELERGKDPSTGGRGQVRERAELATARSESPAKSRPGSAETEEQADKVEGNFANTLLARETEIH